jgi:DNA-binding MarR family transcriptional regulator
MIKDGLVLSEAGASDGRHKMIRLTPKGKDMVAALKVCWQATAIASASLEADLPFPLAQVLDSAIAALAAKPFGDRIREARSELNNQTDKETP